MFVGCTISAIRKRLFDEQRTFRMCTVFEGDEQACIRFIKEQAEDGLRVLMNTGEHVYISTKIDRYAYARIVVDDLDGFVHTTTYELSSLKF